MARAVSISLPIALSPHLELEIGKKASPPRRRPMEVGKVAAMTKVGIVPLCPFRARKLEKLEITFAMKSFDASGREGLGQTGQELLGPFRRYEKI